ncbi:MAG TPA: hypothetical protein VKB26_13805 [Candidatus Acidoferrales bacterium]|nr:hypothetical protein [Candidatus Acidoferrales bacterium]
MNLKILVLCRLTPWILSQIWQIVFASPHFLTCAAAHLMNFCRALSLAGFSRIAVIIAVCALFDRPNSHSGSL